MRYFLRSARALPPRLRMCPVRRCTVIESEEEVVGGRHPSEASVAIGPFDVVARA